MGLQLGHHLTKAGTMHIMVTFHVCVVVVSDVGVGKEAHGTGTDERPLLPEQVSLASIRLPASMTLSSRSSAHVI